MCKGSGDLNAHRLQQESHSKRANYIIFACARRERHMLSLRIFVRNRPDAVCPYYAQSVGKIRM